MRKPSVAGGIPSALLLAAFMLHAPFVSAAEVAGPAETGGTVQPVRALIAAVQDSTLSAQMTGRIANVDTVLGEHVKKGQAILRFDCDEQQARLNMAKAELDGARALYQTKSQLQKMQSASMLEVSQAYAAEEKAKAQIKLYRVQLQMCSIDAPFPGRVTRLRVKAFESVSIGQPLVDLTGDTKLKIVLNIPSDWVPQIRQGQAFTVHIDETGKDYAAQVWHINGRVDAVSQTIAIEGAFSKHPADLLPGMSGTATFPGLAP